MLRLPTKMPDERLAPPTATEIYAVWPQSHYLPIKTRTAIDALVAEIPGKVGDFERAWA